MDGDGEAYLAGPPSSPFLLHYCIRFLFRANETYGSLAVDGATELAAAAALLKAHPARKRNLNHMCVCVSYLAKLLNAAL